jgi:hypothetical protein
MRKLHTSKHSSLTSSYQHDPQNSGLFFYSLPQIGGTKWYENTSDSAVLGRQGKL